jgi:hypothetical protein
MKESGRAGRRAKHRPRDVLSKDACRRLHRRHIDEATRNEFRRIERERVVRCGGLGLGGAFHHVEDRPWQASPGHLA